MEPSLWSNKKIPSVYRTYEAPCVRFREGGLPGKKRGMYRGSPQRQEIFHIPHFRFQVRKLWSTEKLNVGIHGASKSSAHIWNEQVYAPTDASWFYTYDKWTGELNWKFYFGNSIQGIHSSPLFDESSVYLGSYRGAFYKIDQKDGKLIWMRDIGNSVGASPFVVDEHILIPVETNRPANGYLVKMDLASCEVLWRSAYLGEQSHSSAVYDPVTNSVLLGANNSTLQSYDWSTGKLKWRIPLGGAMKSTPWLEGDSIFVTSWGNELLRVRISDGKILWKAPLKIASMVSPIYLATKDIVIASDFYWNVYAVDAKTGSIRWTIKTDEYVRTLPQKSSPIVLKAGQEERVLFYCGISRLCLIHPDGRVEKNFDVESYFSGSLFIDSYDPQRKKTLLPMIFDEGPLVMYEMVF